mmetsp:Transcript_23052/g.25596  ORF Transcript_23052/g.25596 Transcript_23052/m.25596 type:complete len:104 (+) Transcript_23052:109-420(+)|eukprot:CAMPEP_0205824084 /NCGR_PEP_ID=MMETSP0206-20130828/19361_1 /ASSEMBLY_ACC=CAM_ASM_000279 /TAXON_ID=36767 /ORGANISM="Euplotes focardii, Strain TN1" /LENGTH=103 /DNA_ID=CAMNT_0053121865 /DNA_START=109 /DNA_END=416 /DNA_ORIENTATION=-
MDYAVSSSRHMEIIAEVRSQESQESPESQESKENKEEDELATTEKINNNIYEPLEDANYSENNDVVSVDDFTTPMSSKTPRIQIKMKRKIMEDLEINIVNKST